MVQLWNMYVIIVLPVNPCVLFSYMLHSLTIVHVYSKC